MHIVREYAFVDAGTAERVGIPLDRFGYPDEVGLLYVEDPDTAQRFTTVGDAALVRMYVQACSLGLMGGTECPGLPLMREGWPDEWCENTAQASDPDESDKLVVGIRLPSSDNRSEYL